MNRYSAEATSALPNGLFLIGCMAIAAALIWDAAATTLVTLSPLADYWGNVAVLREWTQNLASPGNPAVNDTALTPQFVPLYWLLAMLGRALGLDAIQLMTVAGVVNFVLLATGLKLFLGYYFRHAWAAFIGLLVLFFCWGVTGSGPGLFRFGSFVQVAGDPSTFAFALSLIAFWVTMRLLRSEVTLPLWAIGLAALVALIFVSHPLTGLFCVVGCVVLLITEFTTSQVTKSVAFFAAIAGLAMAELWPYFSVWKLALAGYSPDSMAWLVADLLGAPLEQYAANNWDAMLYDPSALVATLGIALIGIPLLLHLMRTGEQPFIIYGALLMLAPYALNLIVDIPLAHRFLLFAVFYLQLALIWGWLRLISAWSEIPRPALAAPLLLMSIVAGAALVAANFWLVQQEEQGRVFSASTLKLVESGGNLDGLSVPELYEELLEPVSTGATVLTPAVTGGPIPAFGRKLVAPLSMNPLVPDMHERVELTAGFFNKPLTDLERVAIIQRYDVSHVLVSTEGIAANNPASLQTWLDSYSSVVAQRGDWRVYELAKALHQVQLPQPEPDKAVTTKVNSVTKKSATTVKQTESRTPAQPAGQATGGDEAEAPAPGDDEQAAPRSFGAPIAAPVLDPERHGG